MIEVLLLSLFPAAGALMSGLLALVFRLSAQNVAFALHVGAGVVLGVVGVEILPRALDADPPIVFLLAFVIGSIVFVVLDWAAEHLGKRFGGPNSGAAIGIVFGVGIDMLVDGMMLAAGHRLGEGLGLLLALSLFVANSPTTFSTMATVRNDLSWRTSLGIAIAFPIIFVLGVPIGRLALSGQPQIVELAMLSFTAGVLVLVVVEGLIPEAHHLTRRQAGISAMLFSIAFTAFAALSLYLG